MRVLILGCGLILATINLNAATIHVPADQPTIQWVKTYGGDIGDRAFRIIQTPDSGYAFLGATMSFAEGNDDYWLVRLNPDGDTLWTKTYGGPEGVAPRDIINTFDGGFMICGNNTNYGYDSTFFALKTDSLGTEEWMASVGYRNSHAKAVVQSPDSGFLFACLVTNASGIGYWSVLKIDNDGDSLWLLAFTADSADISISEIIRVDNDNYIVSGSHSYTGAYQYDVFVAKLADDGSVLWSQHFGSGTRQSANRLAQISDSTIVAAGSQDYHATFWVLDLDGAHLDSLQFGDSAEYAGDVSATVDGGFILCTTIEESPFPDKATTARIRKYDSLFNEQWVTATDSSFDEVEAYSIQQTCNGGFIFGGRASNHATSPDIDMYALKIATELPHLSLFLIDNENPNTHCITDTPIFEWSIIDPEGIGQQGYEIQVGLDNDWTVAEMWASGEVTTSDTAATYSGLPLSDGTTYQLRIRVANVLHWSPWYSTWFRLNSIPSVPTPLSPIDDVIVGTTPALWVENSTDAEGDTLTYDFLVDVDTLYGEPDPVLGYGIPEGEDSTGWQVTESLDENKRYVWIVRAFDGYEYSDWTGGYEYTFFVNNTPEPPTTPQAQFPPDTSGLPVFDMLPTFLWAESTDPDPLDTVRYKLEIAVDSTFIFVNTIDSIESVPFTLDDSLSFGTRYWWRVTAFDKTGLSTLSPNTPDYWTWTLGDVDHSHDVSVGDLTYLVAYLFQGGQPIYPLFVGDIDGSCAVDVGDLTYLVAYLFQSGPPPKVGCEKRIE
ncbi:MAG: hypothetical protein ABII79_11230 [bacterium]